MHLNTSTRGINYEPEMLPESSSAIFPKPSEEDALVRHKEFLEEIIDSDFGLLDKLLQTGTLSWREIADIKAKDTFYRRNYELLDLISEKNKYDCLISALIDTNQLHVVNYLNGDGGEQDIMVHDTNKTTKYLSSIFNFLRQNFSAVN